MNLPIYEDVRMHDFPWTSLVTLITLIVYLVLTIRVSAARAKYKIAPPQMSGDPNFERVLRVQQNTLEQLPLFLPSLWIFAQFVSSVWAAAIGAAWIVGRIAYAWGYYQAPEKRTLGFGINSLATTVLLGGALVGVIWHLLQSTLGFELPAF
jgi:uncharacterized membrane protein YecN with MAPEG domain